MLDVVDQLGLWGPCYSACYAGCEQCVPRVTGITVWSMLATTVPVGLIVRYCSFLFTRGTSLFIGSQVSDVAGYVMAKRALGVVGGVCTAPPRRAAAADGRVSWCT